MAAEPNWRSQGAAKRQATLDTIPEKWRLQDPIPPATEVPDVTGPYIQQYLSKREIEITESDAVDIAAQTTSGNWSAVEVTEAFCHRAALAHQLVCPYPDINSANTQLTLIQGQLFTRDLLRCSHRRCKETRCLFRRA